MPSSSNIKSQYEWASLTKEEQEIILAYRRADEDRKLLIDAAAERWLRLCQTKLRPQLRLVKSEINARINHD